MGGGSSTFKLPEEVYESLVCSECCAYLSCGPVKLLHNKKYLCGRCTFVKYVPQSLYDKVMKKTSFPCRYKKKGCTEYLLFNNVKEHENVCVYRTFRCPSSRDLTCKELICLKEAKEHFQNKHFSLVLQKDEFIIKTGSMQQQNLVLFKNDDLVIIQYCYKPTTQMLYIDLSCFTNQPNKVLSYNLEFVNVYVSDCKATVPKKTCSSYDLIMNDVYANVINMAPYFTTLRNPFQVTVKILIS